MFEITATSVDKYPEMDIVLVVNSDVPKDIVPYPTSLARMPEVSQIWEPDES